MSLRPSVQNTGSNEAGAPLIDFKQSDVTAQLTLEHRLRQSEARFVAAIEATHGVLWTNDAQGCMVGDQPGWAKLTGQTRAQYQGYGWAKAVHPDDAQPTIDAWNASVAALEPFRFEHRVRRHDGQWRLFSVNALPVFDEAGLLVEWVGVHTDITDATAARERQAQNARTFEALVRNNPFGIHVIDANFCLLHVSAGAKKMFGDIDPLIGRDLAELAVLLWADPVASETVGHFRHTLATGEPYTSNSTVETRRNTNTDEIYDWRIERIVLPDGSNGVVCYFYDLTERVALEEDLRRALEHKDLMAREIEHRVQNSLTIVAGLLTMQERSVPELAAKDALAAASLRVLAIGRVHRQLYLGDLIGIVEFGQYLKQLCSDVEHTLGREGIAFEIDVASVEVPVDMAVPLGIIANELLTNACKYCAGFAQVLVSVSLVAAAGELVMTVSDNGPGMPGNFKPGRGGGLGLEVISALVEQVGGTMDYPAAGAAAHFTARVPLAAPASPAG